MEKRSFDNIWKMLAILLLICLVVPLTAVAVCADQQDYERGYKEGINAGYIAGYNSCKQARDMTYSVAKIQPIGPNDYTDGYTDGYDIGFRRGQRAGGCSS